MLRSIRSCSILLALASAAGCRNPSGASHAQGAPPPEPSAPASVDSDAHQILWQRDLEQALALARAEDRPLFLAEIGRAHV